VARVRQRDLAHRVDVGAEMRDLLGSLFSRGGDDDGGEASGGGGGLDPYGYPGGPLAPGARVDLRRAFHAVKMRTWRESSEIEADALVRDLTALVREYPALLPQEVRQRLVLPVRMPRLEATAYALGALVGGTALAVSTAGAMAAGAMYASGVRSTDDLGDTLRRGGAAARRSLQRSAGLPARDPEAAEAGGAGGEGTSLRAMARREALSQLEREGFAARDGLPPPLPPPPPPPPPLRPRRTWAQFLALRPPQGGDGDHASAC